MRPAIVRVGLRLGVGAGAGAAMVLVGCSAAGGSGSGGVDVGALDAPVASAGGFDPSRLYPAEFVGSWYAIADDGRVVLVIEEGGGFRLLQLDDDLRGMGMSGAWRWAGGFGLELESEIPDAWSVRVWVDPDEEAATVMMEDGRVWVLDGFDPADEEAFDRAVDVREEWEYGGED